MRKSYLDNIRWITVVLVVIYHVVYMYNAEGILGVVGRITDADPQYVDLYMYAVYTWFMSILFIVSGMCARYSLNTRSEKEFIRSRTRRYLVPSTIGLAAFQFIQGYVNMAIGGAFDTMGHVPKAALFGIMMLSGTGALWYIQVLWLLSMILIPVRRIEKERLWKAGGKTNMPLLAAMTAVCWAFAQILNTPIIAVYRFGLYAFMFFLGYYVFSHDEVIELLKKWFLPLLFIACILGIAFCIVYFEENYAIAPVNRTPLFTSYCWFMCLAVLGGMAKYGDFENRFTKWMGRQSFGLYVFHYLGISIFALYVAKKRIMPAPAAYLLTLICGFLAGYLLYALISRIPFFRWAVLGIGKEKKNVQG